MERQEVQNLIIGAGPGGLAVAGRLRQQNIPFEIIEKTDKIAWTWHNHYDRLLLHTVKQFSHLPGLPFPEDYPLYVPKDDLARYYENYAKHFNITPHFNSAATSVNKEGDKWAVDTSDGKHFLANHVIVASGVNRVPFSPTWPGQDDYQGEIVHSRTYKNAKPFLGKKVLVIGMGNTGAELALDLAESDVEVYISVRSPVTVVPRDVNGRPVQVTAKMLEKIPFGLGDWLGTQIRKIVIGDLSKYGLPMSKVHPAVQLRETGKTPVIDLGTVAMIKNGKIKILPDVTEFHNQGMKFVDGENRDFDVVLLATGYKAALHEFVPTIEGMLDKYQCPKAPIGSGDHKGLYFVGFDNYKLGGILGTIFTDSGLVVDDIADRS
jgi:cation diffusion facilitator CzcD-associated flavoprotein CzcO